MSASRVERFGATSAAVPAILRAALNILVRVKRGSGFRPIVRAVLDRLRLRELDPPAARLGRVGP